MFTPLIRLFSLVVGLNPPAVLARLFGQFTYAVVADERYRSPDVIFPLVRGVGVSARWIILALNPSASQSTKYN